jgi:tRNA nucleotidyltransferase (CCA-adding enzyme)
LNTDFDSIACMVAMQKMYPDAVICPPGTVSRRVKDFLNRHGHLWRMGKPSKIPLDQVTLMVVVDTRARSRLGPFAALVGRRDVEIHVYDHHPPTIDDIPADKVFYEPVGATSSIMVERLLKKGMRVTPEEATLLAMGIYEDTGALTYASTTREDIAAIARLLDMGADLSMVLPRIEATMPANERRLLDALAENGEEAYINGAKVFLTWADQEEYVDCRSVLIHKLRDYCEAQVTIAAVRHGSMTSLIARSAPGIMDVGKFLVRWGGGGHPQAGSASVLDSDPMALAAEVKKQLASAIAPLEKVDAVMTSPVRAISPDTSVADAYRIMLRFGYGAMPVVNSSDRTVIGGVAGIMTRKDLDKAHLHGFDRASVSEFMTEGVITLPAEASVNEAHRMLAVFDFEGLPVLSDGRLVGMVTRADLLRALYQSHRFSENKGADGLLPEERYHIWREPVKDQLEASFDLSVVSLLRRVGEKARALGMRAYLVGGAVRDILTGKKNVDIDISLEGDAEEFIRRWDDPRCRSVVHGRYKTGTLIWEDGFKIDIATARREFYEYAAAMPEVLSDSLKQDLGRRDFTVNAMAISLSEDDWGTLMDFYGGRRDLREDVLRVMHNLSFVDDPSRVLRGVRFEQRLGMSFEDNTLRLLNSALRGGLLGKLSGPRVKMELEIDFSEANPAKVAVRMRDLGVWEALFPGLRFTGSVSNKMRRLRRILQFLKKGRVVFRGDEWLTYLAALLSESPLEVRSLAMDRINLTPSERRVLEAAIAAPTRLRPFFASTQAKRACSEVYLFLKAYSPVSLAYCLACEDKRGAGHWIAHHLTVLSATKCALTGGDLRAMGYAPGPWIGDMLETLRLEHMDGKLTSREDEVEFVKDNLIMSRS